MSGCTWNPERPSAGSGGGEVEEWGDRNLASFTSSGASTSKSTAHPSSPQRRCGVGELTGPPTLSPDATVLRRWLSECELEGCLDIVQQATGSNLKPNSSILPLSLSIPPNKFKLVYLPTIWRGGWSTTEGKETTKSKPQWKIIENREVFLHLFNIFQVTAPACSSLFPQD